MHVPKRPAIAAATSGAHSAVSADLITPGEPNSIAAYGHDSLHARLIVRVCNLTALSLCQAAAVETVVIPHPVQK